METSLRIIDGPSQCYYLPDQLWTTEHELVVRMSPEEYDRRLSHNWRRFGYTLFRPVCTNCAACQSLRVVVDRFRPNRSQKRCAKKNQGSTRLQVGLPKCTAEKLALCDKYHEYKSRTQNWPPSVFADRSAYDFSFVHNPIPTEEWCYYDGERLVGVGYVDAVPSGLSAIYFFYDPEYRDRGLGTWNVLSMIEECRRRGLPFLYLGYYVENCRSVNYKARFRPNQILVENGRWMDFRE